MQQQTSNAYEEEITEKIESGSSPWCMVKEQELKWQMKFEWC